MPSYEQLLKVVQICHALSDLRQDILLFLFDEEMQEFFILAGKTARRDANSVASRRRRRSARMRCEITIYSDATHSIEIGDEL